MSDSIKAPISESFDVLFERIAALEAERDAAKNLSSNLMQAGELIQTEVAALRAENKQLCAALQLMERRHEAEIAEKNREIERLKAPVSDEEWEVTPDGRRVDVAYGNRVRFDAIIAARASTPKSVASSVNPIHWWCAVLLAEGLMDWTITIAADPYCFTESKTIQLPAEAPPSLFLHEVAHAIYQDPEGDMKNHYHGGKWASEYGRLIDRWMIPMTKIAASPTD